MLKQLAGTTNAWSGHPLYLSTLPLVIYDSVRSEDSSQFDLSVEISSSTDSFDQKAWIWNDFFHIVLCILSTLKSSIVFHSYAGKTKRLCGGRMEQTEWPTN